MENRNEYELEKYLRKCELQWRAEHKPEGGELDWLAPHCDSVQEIAKYLREIGFKVRRTIDEVTEYGDVFKWVETTSGVIVYVNDENLKGLYARSYRDGRDGR